MCSAPFSHFEWSVPIYFPSWLTPNKRTEAYRSIIMSFKNVHDSLSLAQSLIVQHVSFSPILFLPPSQSKRRPRCANKQNSLLHIFKTFSQLLLRSVFFSLVLFSVFFLSPRINQVNFLEFGSQKEFPGKKLTFFISFITHGLSRLLSTFSSFSHMSAGERVNLNWEIFIRNWNAPSKVSERCCEQQLQFLPLHPAHFVFH